MPDIAAPEPPVALLPPAAALARADYEQDPDPEPAPPPDIAIRGPRSSRSGHWELTLMQDGKPRTILHDNLSLLFRHAVRHAERIAPVEPR